MKRILFLLFITLMAIQATAQDVVQLSLDDCMHYALKHNYAVKNARIDVRIQNAQNNETIAAAYPKITGHAEFDDYVVPQQSFFPVGSIGSSLEPYLGPLYAANPNVPNPFTTATSSTDQYEAIQISPQYAATASVAGTQPLFDGSILIALKARKAFMELANETANVTDETVRYNIYKAYKSLVIAYRQFDITKNSLQYQRKIQQDLIITQQNGLAEKIEVERTDVQVNNLATDSIRASNLLTVSEQTLKYQMGMDINTPIALTDTNVDENKGEALELLQEEKDYNRVPEFNLYNTQLTLNEYNVRRYKLTALPTLNLIANAGYNNASQNFSDMLHFGHYLSSAMVGLQLNVPIFNGFLRTNQLREAKLNVEKSKNNIENEKLTIDFQAAQSHTTLTNALLQAEGQHRNLDLAMDVLDLAQKKYKAGVGSNLEVTQAQTDQLTAENNYFNSLLNVINAEADLKKALGLLK